MTLTGAVTIFSHPSANFEQEADNASVEKSECIYLSAEITLIHRDNQGHEFDGRTLFLAMRVKSSDWVRRGCCLPAMFHKPSKKQNHSLPSAYALKS